MKKQITRISPLQTSKVLAAMYFLISLPMVLIMLVPLLFADPKPAFFSGFMLALPFLYAIFGFIFTLIGAWLYNVVAKYLGGIEYTTTQGQDI
jgi:hypothetical protein